MYVCVLFLSLFLFSLTILWIPLCTWGFFLLACSQGTQLPHFITLEKHESIKMNLCVCGDGNGRGTTK